MVNCTSGLNGLLSGGNFVDEGKSKYLWQQTWSTLEQQIAAESCCTDWPGAGSPSCRVKSLPDSHLWMFWAASQCLRQGAAFLSHFLHWGWGELRCAKAWNTKVSIGITCYNTCTNTTVSAACLHHLLWWSRMITFYAVTGIYGGYSWK